MPILALLLGFALAGAPSDEHAVSDRLPIDTITSPAQPVSDTTARLRFEIQARPLVDALSEFSRQAGVAVQLERESVAGLRSRAVVGVYTPPEALRLLLEGTGLKAEYAEGAALVVIRGASSELPVYTLAGITVTGAVSRGYTPLRSSSATRTDTPLRDTPLSVSVVTSQLIRDQAMQGLADLVHYVPGVTMGQGEGHRDAPTIRGNSTTANFFVNGVRDDAQYYRDLYNAERVETLKGANALAFGRGGGGGVINRVTKVAQWIPVQRLTLEGGSFDHKRATFDVGRGFGARVAARLNGMYEESGGFRDAADLSRVGLNPTLALALGPRTTLHLGYEYLDDDRVVDRGIPSFEGRPARAPIERFFGNPELNRSTLELHAASASLEHTTAGGVTVRSRFHFADYDKFYQNTFPGAVNATATEVRLSAYNNATDRRNYFNQTDLVYELNAGGVRHTLLAGFELGRQETESFRQTGYYNDTDANIDVPFAQPTVSTPVVFRQSATDADNSTKVTVGSIYVQDQVELTRRWHAVVGVRLDRFEVDFHNNRNGEELSRRDDLLSPRAGLIYKPAEAVSLYGSYGVTYLPSSGDQFASLTASMKALEPEKFANKELGVKWEPRPDLVLTGAVYRLDRTNTAAPDPSDPSKVVQTGHQRTEGLELEGSGRVTSAWQVVGGVAYQRAEIVSATSAAPEGAKVQLVPEWTVSLWNRYQLLRQVGVGVGLVHQTEMFAAIDNAVTLPGFTRIDAALYFRLGDVLSAQVNVENLFDEKYYPTSHGNNNIMPGAPRTLRISLTAGR